MSYSEKLDAAHQAVELKQFPSMRDAGGRLWPGERYHIMYTGWFTGYFLYKISGITGKLEPHTGSTWWNFDIQMANDEEHSDSFEQPLPATEVKAWLALNYSSLLAEDYEHLIDILHLQHTPDGSVVHQIRNHYNWHQAWAWLTKQHARATISSNSVNGSSSTQSTPATINPWVPLLTGSMQLADFYSYLENCGLLNANGELTILGKGEGTIKARRAPWVGALLALKEKYLLDNNIAAIIRALAAPQGKLQVKLAENTLSNPSRKSKTYQQIAEAIMTKQGYLQN